MSAPDAEQIARGLTPEQAAWILIAPEGEQPCTEAEYNAAPLFFVQFSPDEHCPYTGVYLGGGERYWFASGTERCSKEGWQFSYGLNETGLAVRAYAGEKGSE